MSEYLQYSYYSNSTDAATAAIDLDNNFDDLTGNQSGKLRIALYSGTTPGTVGSVTLGSIGSYTSWFAYEWDSGPLTGPYQNGDTIPGLSLSGSKFCLYPAPSAPCFLEGSQILCLVDEKEIYLPIEKIRKGTLVKTSKHGYKMVHVIGKRDIPNFSDSNRIKDRLYKLTTAKYPTLTSDLYLTGCHSTLVDSLTSEQKDSIKKMLGVVCVTDAKYRLPACVDQNAEPWQSEGTYTVWHFALDSENPLINFGVYANGGLLVETGSIRYLEGKANMEFV